LGRLQQFPLLRAVQGAVIVEGDHLAVAEDLELLLARARVAHGRICQRSDHAALVRNHSTKVVVRAVEPASRGDRHGSDAQRPGVGKKGEEVVNVAGLPQIAPPAFRSVEPVSGRQVSRVHAVNQHRRIAGPCELLLRRGGVA
jgi:hypothetical protein